MKRYLRVLKNKIYCPHCGKSVPLRRCLGATVVECTYCYELSLVKNQLRANLVYLFFAALISFIVIFFEFKVSLKYIFPLILFYILGGVTIYSNILRLDREFVNEPEF